MLTTDFRRIVYSVEVHDIAKGLRRLSSEVAIHVQLFYDTSSGYNDNLCYETKQIKIN